MIPNTSSNDAAVLLRSRVDFVKPGGPTIGECWLLDAANHIDGGQAFADHRRASAIWPDAKGRA